MKTYRLECQVQAPDSLTAEAVEVELGGRLKFGPYAVRDISLTEVPTKK